MKLKSNYKKALTQKRLAGYPTGHHSENRPDYNRCVQKNHRLYLIGNGGSAADAQHIAGELIGRFKINRRPLPAIALSTDTSVITALANDFGYDTCFARQIEARLLLQETLSLP